MEKRVYEVQETAEAYRRQPKGKRDDNEFSYVVKEHIGVLNTNKSGWSKELNVISWNGNPEKYDLRDWSQDHTKMSRGITLFKEEVKALYDMLCGMDVVKGNDGNN